MRDERLPGTPEKAEEALKDIADFITSQSDQLRDFLSGSSEYRSITIHITKYQFTGIDSEFLLYEDGVGHKKTTLTMLGLDNCIGEFSAEARDENRSGD